MDYRLKGALPYRRRARPAPREVYTVPTHYEWLMGRLFDDLSASSMMAALAEDAANYHAMMDDFAREHPPFSLRECPDYARRGVAPNG